MSMTLLGHEWLNATRKAKLSPQAQQVFVHGLIWSNENDLDLHIPKDDLHLFAFVTDALEAADELVQSEFWIDQGDTWFAAFHSEWQHTAAQRKARLDGQRKRQQRHRQKAPVDEVNSLPGDEVTRDTTGDVTRAIEKSREEQKRAVRREQQIYAQNCDECQRRSVFDSGPCPSHPTMIRAAS